MRSDFEKAFKKEYPHADYLACLKFDEVENQYKPINEEVEPPDVNFWVCVGVNTGWWAWQYRQTEVDEARAKAQMCRDEKTHAINRWSAVCKERDELQKRVDAAKYYMKNIFSVDAEVDQCHLGDLLDILDGKIVDEIEQALKGD